MPATRVTLTSNANQLTKAPLLVPSSASSDPAAPSSYRSLVIKTAQSKLRLKKPSRVFVAGGKELLNAEDWKTALKDDTVLLVSAGEDYVGARQEVAVRKGAEDINPDCSIENLANKAFVDDLSLRQLECVAHTLPGIVHACAQPDLHPGTKFPIGAVLVSRGWIHPPLIGSDIGCGMAWYKTTLTRAQVEGDKGRKIAERLRGLEGAWRRQRDREVWLSNSNGESCKAGKEWDASLGTIGAGNHFAEVQVVEESQTDVQLGDTKRQLHETDVVLLVHSGSRGFGGDILRRYTSNGHISLKADEPTAQSYLEEHDRACDWASRNRDLIALRFLACLEPGNVEWELGINSTPSQEISPQSIMQARSLISDRKVVDIWHNNVSITTWPPSPSPNPSNSSTTTPPKAEKQEKVFIHRKGAAPTYNHSTNLPLSILPLPGSRATPTLILHPTFPKSTSYGLTNALSLAHGAGRAMARAKAATYIASKYKGRAEDLLRGDYVSKDAKGNRSSNVVAEGEKGEDVHGGTWVVCEDKELVWEEAGEAYKDVWAVGEDLVTKGVAERWGWCRGRVSYKVRKE